MRDTNESQDMAAIYTDAGIYRFTGKEILS